MYTVSSEQLCGRLSGRVEGEICHVPIDYEGKPPEDAWQRAGAVFVLHEARRQGSSVEAFSTLVEAFPPKKRNLEEHAGPSISLKNSKTISSPRRGGDAQASPWRARSRQVPASGCMLVGPAAPLSLVLLTWPQRSGDLCPSAWPPDSTWSQATETQE